MGGLLTRRARTISQLHRIAEEDLLEQHLAKEGDTVVFIAGTLQVSGATNTVQICRLGEKKGA